MRNTLLLMATGLRILGNSEEGIRLLEHGADVRNGDSSMFLAWGDFYCQIEESDKATAAIQRSKQLSVPN